MHRIRIAAVLGAAATALVVLCMPATALAGTYTWNLATDFTTAPGANPDHDHYGASPWSYSQGAAGSLDPATFQLLGAFNPSFQGGLAGWASDSTQSPVTFVATNPVASPISSPPATFPQNQIAMLPAPGNSVVVGWTSPLTHAATVNVTGTVTDDDSPATCLAPDAISWTLATSGMALQTGDTTVGAISASPTVQPGATIYLIVSSPSALVYSQACVATGLALQIQASQSTGPAVSVTSPAIGSITGGGQPRFVGSAATSFGVSKQVTARIYSGPSASGTPVQTLTGTESGGAWSVDPSAALADGVYTVQAEQDDISSPPDAGLSAPITFIVYNALPKLELDSPGTTPLRSATPTLRGVAGTASGDASKVTLIIYPGSGEAASPVLFLSATADARGHYSATVAPALADGRYTVVAAQATDAGTTGLSQPRTFRIKVHGPTLVFDQPSPGLTTGDRQPAFAGLAGTALGDSTMIVVPLYAGKAAKGRLIGTLHVFAVGAHWSRRWPRRLPPGVYTAEAIQRDDAGHTSASPPHTFRILGPPSVIGSALRLDRSGNVSLAVTCTEAAGKTCVGTVLILTTASFEPVAGGPIGQVRVLFSYITIPGGRTVVVRGAVSSRLARLLAPHLPLRVRITTTFGDPTAHPTVFTALGLLRP